MRVIAVEPSGRRERDATRVGIHTQERGQYGQERQFSKAQTSAWVAFPGLCGAINRVIFRRLVSSAGEQVICCLFDEASPFVPTRQIAHTGSLAREDKRFEEGLG